MQGAFLSAINSREECLTFIENDFTDALKEELDVAEKLPGAIEKAKKEGVFD